MPGYGRQVDDIASQLAGGVSGVNSFKSLMDLLRSFSPQGPAADAPPPMVASPEMMQGVPGAQPVPNPRAQQPSSMEQALRFLGLR